MPNSVYIHIPFCKSKCKYCSFVSYVTDDEHDAYIRALLREINFFYRGETLKTLYFGGGTPSLLSIKDVEKVINNFIIIPDFCEITFEMNPDDSDKGYLKRLRELGVNRISLGSQTFDDNILEEIGRRHNSKQIIDAVEDIKSAGFNNISLDLIYGLPGQTMDILNKDLETVTQLGIQHVSTYGLKIEHPSYYASNLPENLPDDDTQADMYLRVNEFLESHGYMRYEISNFAKPKFESKHNLNYWNNKEYYGFGAAAHGYRYGVRYSNRAELEDYIRHPIKKATEHYVTPKEKFEEEIFLGFRKEAGINTESIKKKYYVDFDEKFKPVIEKYSPEYIEKTAEGYKLTLKGVLLSNQILAEFIEG